jgi:signal transduction histidine kinase
MTIKAGIHSQLVMLVIGVVIPLAFVGLIGIMAMWDANRHQLDDSIKKQAEIAAVSFEQWLDTQREPLATVAAYFADRPTPSSDLLKMLRLIADTRPHWVSLHIVRADGALIVQPPDAPKLPDGYAAKTETVDMNWSRDNSRGLLIIAVPIENGGAVIAQIDVLAMSDSFLREVKLPDQAVFSIFGPERRIILYRNPTPETYLGKDMSDSPFFSAISNQTTAVVELKSPIDGVRRVYGVARAGETGCVVLVGLSSETLYAPARGQLNRYVVFSLAALLLAVVAAIILARSIARPISRLSEVARRFGSGALSTRAEFSVGGEIEELRASFNSMAEQIEEREARLKELDRLKSDFVSGVSHEMRTPLTTVKTLTDVLLRGKVSEAEQREFLETIAAECDRQIDLVLNLLDLSRIEAGIFNLTLSSVDVKEIINSCVITHQHNAEAYRHELRAELPDELPPVLADRKSLRRVLCGLVENAIKYTPDGGSITVTASSDSNEVKIGITDNGRGILAEDLPHIFEKFYRGRSLQSSVSTSEAGTMGQAAEVPGVGLGLYLARTIIEEINGRITVESAVGRGSTFTVYLPLWDNKDNAE